ncbi:hypothetical protein [Streptosporangium sp. NPDC004631]
MTVRLTAEWALWGKQPGTRDGDEILACSDGRLGRDEFSEIITRYAPGTPTELPQVTISWFGGGDSAHLGLAIQEWSDERDGLGRDIAITRYFCVPYAEAAKGPVSCDALYHAFAGRALPVDGPLLVDVPVLDPESTAGAVDQTVMGAAALLLTGQPVCVVNGEGVPMIDRLVFFEAVAALLPYGFRSRMTASTWTSSASRHRIRLSFTRHAPAGAHSISWGRGAEIPDGQEVARDYHDTLVNCDRLGELIARFAQETRPRSMNADGLAGILPLLGGFGVAPAPRPPGRGGPGTAADDPPAVRADGPERADHDRIPHHVAQLKLATARARESGERVFSVFASMRTEDLVDAAAWEPADPLTVRTVCDELVRRGGDLAGRSVVAAALRRCGYLVAAIQQLHPGDPESQVQRHRALLTAAYGPVLDRRALRRVLSPRPRPSSPPLLAALTLVCAPDARQLLMEEVFFTVLDQGGITPAILDRIREGHGEPVPGTFDAGGIGGGRRER